MSETSMYRVLDEMDSSFQSEVVRVEGNRDSVLSGMSGQTIMMRARNDTNTSMTSF